MPEVRTINWWEVDKPLKGLAIDEVHLVYVRREAIPLIFVPGIMGTCLRRGKAPLNDGEKGLPAKRWNPSSSWDMFWDHSNASGEKRKWMLVGPRFNPDYLEVDNATPVGNGFDGIMADYLKFLKPLKERDWGVLKKIFEFPVYAVGYNWTGDNADSGAMLAERIDEIIAEAKSITGLCEKVILITHSMGGIMARAASELSGAGGKILGIVHGVQPATGAPAAYWRIKAGFDANWNPLNKIASRVLGHSGDQVTPVLANIPGGLELLPTKNHHMNSSAPQWLRIRGADGNTKTLPMYDPYEELYRLPAVVRPKDDKQRTKNAYWGLVDPDLLDPGNTLTPTNADDAALNAARPDPWAQFIAMLKLAEDFHDHLSLKAHLHTLSVRGTGRTTADAIEFREESTSILTGSDVYDTREFRAFFNDGAGEKMQSKLQDPQGDGDGTVVQSSAHALDVPGRPSPGDTKVEGIDHQSAYNEYKEVQEWAFKAIKTLCKIRYYEKRPR